MQHFARAIYLTAAMVTLAASAYARGLDLTKVPVFVTNGFDARWLTDTRILSNGMRIHAEKRPGMLIPGVVLNDPDAAHAFLSLKRSPDKIYTAAMPFVADDAFLSSEKPRALFVPQLGLNYEVYVNAHRIHHYLGTNALGQVVFPLMYRNLIASIPFGVLKRGENMLTFVLIGEPSYIDTSIVPHPRIDYYSRLIKEVRNPFALSLIVLYAFVGLFHLFIFFRRMSERYNLFYGLFSMSLFIYLFSRTPFMYELPIHSDLMLSVELTSLYLLLPLIAMFFDTLFLRKITVATIVYSVIVSLIAAVSFVAPSGAFRIDLLRIWQISAIPAMLFFIFFRIGNAFRKEVRGAFADVQPRPPLIRRSIHALIRTVPGNLIIGALVVVGCAIFDIVDSMALAYNLVLTTYGFLLFVTGTTFVITNRFISLATMNEALNVDLAGKVTELAKASRNASISEVRYRRLFEGSSDIILMLDETLTIRSANAAVATHLKHRPENVIGMPFTSLIYMRAGDDTLSQAVINERLREFAAVKEALTLDLEFATAAFNEPREMQVRFEHVTIEGTPEILVRAVPVGEDTLGKYLAEEAGIYRIENHLALVEDVTRRLTKNLRRYVDFNTISLIRLALREMMINAMEHGNLNITFDEKTEAQMNDRYVEFICERKDDERYSARRVTVRYDVNPMAITFVIRDEGVGFDWKKRLAVSAEKENEAGLSHGRGIRMANDVFSEIRYNESGNQVTLIRRLSDRRKGDA
ncbi:MAG: ATP-binding protein [Spirochaetota bacterium]